MTLEATPKIRPIEMRLLDDLFGMPSGYVLDFSNRTFSEFFREELSINIDDPKYEVEGTSKGKRLRYFLNIAEPQIRLRTLLALWEYREDQRRRTSAKESIPDAAEQFYSLIERLGGTRPPDLKRPGKTDPASSLDPSLAIQLRSRLLAANALEAQARGYEYERFLRALFDANGLSARASFRLVGEQIDGSFQLDAETYLLEAKWTKEQVGVSDLRSFNAKVEDKAAWSRGLFVSDSGFSPDGLEAFGRAKRVICMDGLDLSDMLERKLPIGDVLAKKVRRAAETGKPFVRVRDLYP